MKKTFTILLSLCSLLAQAQNWQCLQSGVKHYFTNGNGYLRGIRIDSVKTFGDSTVYYPFHTSRGSYTMSYVVPSLADSNGGSWLGKAVVQRNGTFIFDSYWSDSVVIKTQAEPGESWVLYRDSSTRYYKATVTAIDTMTISGGNDSVKKILITAQDTGGIVATDPVDSFQIILSKNHGFIQVCDLYTFPYHKPDSTWRPGLDLFLDRSSCDYTSINSSPGNIPNANITLFRLTDFINPTEQQLYNWNIGDTLVGYHFFSPSPPSYGMGGYDAYIPVAVTGKVRAGHAVTYMLSGAHYSCTNYGDPCWLIVDSGSYSYYDNIFPIADTILMPEETGHSTRFIFYFPADSGYCQVAPSYMLEDMGFFPGDSHIPVVYKLGIGKVSSNDNDETDVIWGWDNLAYYNIGGHRCGYYPSRVSNINALAGLQIFPNPATNELTIKMSNTQPVTISLINILGQTVKTVNSDKQEVTIAVDKVPAGIYTVMLTNGSGERINTKAVIGH